MENGPENRPPHQENPNEESEITKKIEVVRAEDFWSPPDDYDYYDQEMIDEAERYAEREPEEEPLPYTPFDPKVELKNIRKLSPEERSLPDEEKRRIRAERLVNFKENLIRQKEGIARAVEELRGAVESTPDATTEALLLKVQALAPEYKFTRDQIAIFNLLLNNIKKSIWR